MRTRIVLAGIASLIMAAPGHGESAEGTVSEQEFVCALAAKSNPDCATIPAPKTKGFRIMRAAVATGRPNRANLLISFDLGSDRMTAAGTANARSFARALQNPQLASRRFAIEGHTDSRGKLASNLDLSRRRASAVADFLVGEGVDRSRLIVRGKGPAEPLPRHRASDPENRRVEAALLG